MSKRNHAELAIKGGAAVIVAMAWLMDGKSFAKGTTAQWLPWPGRQRLRTSTAFTAA